ncbi:S-layer homology domain-containing protein [Brevibacillus humidisoli]|uniref:S-layer homology domain-containing protein n=1 Tax=Brevibacillus humidisoli TaxID=2895522 RepID=UPI001E429B08|nr:S-layer homology domain-containing protein [Brevibacillus humidisoli]UFJ42364.1 S-layer homology domain-containing protein [Brevibacillus humidisoli]
MKRVLSVLLCTLLILTMIPVASAKTTFRDVPRNHWAYEAIMEMADKGIITGYNDRTFRPNNHITRAEFAKIMIAAAGIDITSVNKVKQTFEDVDRRHWAFYYVELAKPYLTGYKVGSTYLYKPNEKALREDIAVALVRLKGYDRTTDPDLSKINRFRDDQRISENLRPFIAIAVETGLIKGFEDNTFRPLHPITRAEAASLIYRAKLDETKVVFPDEPKPQEPELPKSVSDSFSKDDLDHWDEREATATWKVINNRVTAYSSDSDLDHYFLPLIWDEKSKPKKYEIKVDVIADRSDGHGGLFFNGKDGKAIAVSVEEDKLLVEKVEDPEEDDTTTIASVDYDLKTTNQLRIVVDGNAYGIYLNDKFMFGLQNQSIDNTSLGLYLKKEATEDLPREITYFDNFSFRVLN